MDLTSISSEENLLSSKIDDRVDILKDALFDDSKCESNIELND